MTINEGRELNDEMSFDRVIRVHANGTVTHTDLYAPELNATEDDGPELMGDPEWSLMTAGYSGQDRYNGPIMHNSEFIGGTLERDILATPGLYVALMCTWLDTPEDEDNVEGWAVAFRPDMD